MSGRAFGSLLLFGLVFLGLGAVCVNEPHASDRKLGGVFMIVGGLALIYALFTRPRGGGHSFDT